MGNINQITLTIEMPKYLQHYIKYVFLGGKNACNSINNFNQFLEAVLEIRPKDLCFIKPENSDDLFTFELPRLRHKDPLYYNYINPNNNKILIESMKIMFETSLFTCMVQTMKFDYIIDQDRIRCHHGERERAMKEFCYYNRIPFDELDFAYLKRRFTRFIQLHKDYILDVKQLSIHFVKTRKEYHESSKIKSKQYKMF